jgi:hypothetical protein
MLLAALTLSACGGAKTEGGQKVEMRDMEVVDGTTSDAMTDLDAVRTDGTALADASGNSARPAAKPIHRDRKDGLDEAEQDAEAVAAE